MSEMNDEAKDGLSEELRAAAVDRVRELTNIGAGHAAKALADLLGRPCRMRVPMARLLPADRIATPLVAAAGTDDREPMSGVFFEVDGGLGGVLALLLSAGTRTLLVRQLLGDPVADPEAPLAESALREFGNILVSHVASAMADTLGVAVIPSIPLLVEEDAASALASLVGLREPRRVALRIETEISDRHGEIRAVLVFVPDRTTVIASPQAF
jgi:chemotaxis protein CheC